MKDNYKSWEIKIANFPENGGISTQLEFLLGFALLAPSAHNSQPWKCQINKNIISISIERSRLLQEGDPKHRLLFIAFGCFLENLLIAADYFGFISVFNNKIFQNSETLSVELERSGSTKNDQTHLIFQIVKRRNNRLPYSNERIGEQMKMDLEQMSSEIVNFILVNDINKKNELSKIMVAAQIETMNNAKFRAELSNYFKQNNTEDKIGMPGFTLGIPTFISYFASKLVKIFNISKINANKELRILTEHTPAIGVLCTKNDDEVNWIETGRILERSWLTVTKKGFAYSVWAAPVQIDNYRQNIKNVLGNNLLPTIVFRIGRPIKETKPSPRLELKNILHNAS